MRSLAYAALLASPLFALLTACSGALAPDEQASRLGETQEDLVALQCPHGESPVCIRSLPFWVVRCFCAASPPTSWARRSQPFSGSQALGMWLMGDGKVLAHVVGADAPLYKLTPDAAGSYANGTWARAGAFSLEKQFYASQVLSNGKLVTCGGEYAGPTLAIQAESNLCEIYDPRTELSSPVPTPPAYPSTPEQPSPPWPEIGDAASVILTDGTMMISRGYTSLLAPSTLTWTSTQAEGENEQGLVLLPTGDVLTASVNSIQSRRYSQATGTWSYDQNLPVMLGAVVTWGNGLTSDEIGPGLTMMNSHVIWFGASGHTAIYTPTSAGQNGSWAAGPDLPPYNGGPLIAADVPALLEPNGRVLVVTMPLASPGYGVFVEYDPVANTNRIVTEAPVGFSSASTTMLMLPDGHAIVHTGLDWFDVQFATGPQPQWAPAITSASTFVNRGQTVTFAGTQLSGLSEVSAYGDDNQQSENYPVVRVENGSITRYLRAHDVTTRSIAPNQWAEVSIDIPSDLAPGWYTMRPVTMGIPGNGVSVFVE